MSISSKRSLLRYNSSINAISSADNDFSDSVNSTFPEDYSESKYYYRELRSKLEPPQLVESSRASKSAHQSIASTAVSKRKKNGSRKAPQLPPMNDVERRIDDLQRLAMLSQASTISASSLRSDDISNSEAQFLSRQHHQYSEGSMTNIETSNLTPSDTSHVASKSANTSPVAVATPSRRSITAAPTLSNNAQQVSTTLASGAIRDKISELERQNSSLLASVRNKEDELEKKDKKLRSLQQDLEKTRKELALEVRRLHSEHESELLRLRDAHAKEKASLISASGASSSFRQASVQDEDAASYRGSSRGGSDPVGSHESARRIAQQADGLRLELRRAQEAFAEERAALQLEASQRLSQVEKRLRAEIVELKGQNASLEDKLSQSFEDLARYQAEVNSLRGKVKFTEQLHAQAVEEQGKIRADLKNAQASIQASFRLDTHSKQPQSELMAAIGGVTGSSNAGNVTSGSLAFPQRSSLPPDMESSLRLHDATYEAKLKQMANKVEFLKTQLETERRAVDESRQALLEAQRSSDSLKDDFSRKLQEMERVQQMAVAEAEERVTQGYERRMVELTNLQRQLFSLQSETQSLAQDNAASKHNEQVALEQVQRAQVQQLSLRAEIEQLRGQVQQLEALREQEGRKDAGKISQEAVLRRLDNERHYLKNQLAAEITLKTEIQKALSQCQTQLQDMQSQWQKDVDILKESNAKLSREILQKDQLSAGQQAQLQNELSHLTSVNSSLKDAFVKMRDQLRVEQAAIENLQADKAKLREMLAQEKELLQRTKDTALQREATYEQMRESDKALYDDLELLYKKDVNQLKEQLSKEFQDNSAMQREVLRSRETFEKESLRVRQVMQVSRIVGVFNKWTRSRVSRAWRQWSVNTTLRSVAGQFKEQLQTILQSAHAEMQRSHAQAMAAQKSKLDAQREGDIEATRLQGEEDAARALQSLQEEHERELFSEREAHAARLLEAENDFQYDLQRMQREKQREMLEAEGRAKSELQALREHLLSEVQRLDQEKDAAVEDAVRRQTEADARAREQDRAKAKVELQQALQREKQRFEVELDFKMSEQRKAFDEQHKKGESLHAAELLRRDELLVQKEAEWNERFAEEKDEFAAQLREDLAKETALTLSSLRASLHEAEENRVRGLREDWQREFDARVEVEKERLEQEQTARGAALQKALEADKMRAVKCEAAKWKQVLQDTEQRVQLEIDKAKGEAAIALETSFNQQRERLKESFELQRAGDRQKFEAELQQRELELRRENEDVLEAEARRMKTELERFEVEAETRITKRLSGDHNAALQAQQARYEDLLSTERSRNESLKSEIAQRTSHFAAEKASLSASLQSADLRMEAFESIRAAEREGAQKDLQRQSEVHQLNLLEALAQQREQLKAEAQAELDRRKEDWKTDTDIKLRSEREAARADFDRQLALLQDESERLVNQLEIAIDKLRNEKKELDDSLESLTARLSDTEDALFDARREAKSFQKQASLITWQMGTKIAILKTRFQKALDDVDKKAESRFEVLRSTSQSRWNDLALQWLKTCAYVQEVETRRKTLLDLIASYKPEELKRLKKKIQALEREIEKLTLERDSFEESRTQLLLEIEVLTAEVHEQEELVRVHQQESAMSSNGRINLAFARKKRRLDQEIERLLEQIEVKRAHVQDNDEKMLQKHREREEKEAQMIDIERQLVNILIEQQRMSMKEVQDLGGYAEKTRMICEVMEFPWPPAPDPTLDTVKDILEQQAMRKQQEERQRAGYGPAPGH